MNALERLEQAALEDDSRYLLIDKLGQGGMGAVWLAPDAPTALQALLESMTDKDYKQRPRTGELVEQFEDIALELGGRASAVQKAFATRVREQVPEDEGDGGSS